MTIEAHRQRTSRRIFAVVGIVLALIGSAGLWLLRPDPHLVYTIQADAPLAHVVYRPDGQLLATSARNGVIQLWNAADGAAIRSLHGHTREAALAFSPDGRRLVSAGMDGVVYMWEVATGAMLHTLWSNPPNSRYAIKERLQGGTIVPIDEPFASVTFSPDGTLIAAGSDKGRVLLFDTAMVVVQIFQAYSGIFPDESHPVHYIAINGDNQSLISGGFEGLKLWHLPDRRLIKFFTTDNTPNLLYSPAWGTFSPDNSRVRTYYGAGGRGMTPALDVWSLDGRLLTPAPGKYVADLDFVFFKGSTATATSFSVSRDAHLLAWGGGVRYGDYHNVPFIGPQNDPRIVIWRVDEAQPVYTFSGHEDNVDDLAFSPDGTMLASVSYDRTLRVWRLLNQ